MFQRSGISPQEKWELFDSDLAAIVKYNSRGNFSSKNKAASVCGILALFHCYACLYRLRGKLQEVMCLCVCVRDGEALGRMSEATLKKMVQNYLINANILLSFGKFLTSHETRVSVIDWSSNTLFALNFNLRRRILVLRGKHLAELSK